MDLGLPVLFSEGHSLTSPPSVRLRPATELHKGVRQGFEGNKATCISRSPYGPSVLSLIGANVDCHGNIMGLKQESPASINRSNWVVTYELISELTKLPTGSGSQGVHSTVTNDASSEASDA